MKMNALAKHSQWGGVRVRAGRPKDYFQRGHKYILFISSAEPSPDIRAIKDQCFSVVCDIKNPTAVRLVGKGVSLFIANPHRREGRQPRQRGAFPFVKANTTYIAVHDQDNPEKGQIMMTLAGQELVLKTPTTLYRIRSSNR